jgi:predicted  nucleic acid-binding Zn-ribbon protein
VRKESDLHVEEKTLKREIEILIKLQAVDLELYQSERFHQKYPEKLKKLEKKIEEEQVRFQQTKERLEGLQKERKQKEKDLEIEAERVKKAEEKLASVKTNKEYQAAVKEIEMLKQMNSAKEDEILLVMEGIDTLQDEQKKKEKELGEKMKAFQEEKKKLEEEEQKFGAVSEENKVLREDLVR